MKTWLIRTMKFMLTGTMGKEWAGSRALTNKERWTWLISVYSLTAQILYYQWKVSQQEETLDASPDYLRAQLDVLKKENRRLITENQHLREENNRLDLTSGFNTEPLDF